MVIYPFELYVSNLINFYHKVRHLLIRNLKFKKRNDVESFQPKRYADIFLVEIVFFFTKENFELFQNLFEFKRNNLTFSNFLTQI